MADVRVQVVNEAKVRVHCDSGVAAELREHFSYLSPTARYDKRFKAKVWDGMIRLFDANTRILPYGLTWEVSKFCKARGYTFEHDLPVPSKLYSYEDIEQYMQSLNLHANGEPIEARDYQIESVKTALNRRRLLVRSPTASGKSLVIYTLIRRFLEDKDEKVILIVPSTHLVEQMYSDFADYSQADDSFDSEEMCQRLYGAYPSKVVTKRVLISTWQSLQNLETTWFQQFGMLLVDEAHGAQAKEIKRIAEAATNATYRIGLTGTLKKDKLFNATIVGLFGPVRNVITTKELMDRGDVSKLRIKAIEIQYSEVLPKVKKMERYHKEIEWLFAHKKRNLSIVSLMKKAEGNTIVFFSRISHGQELYDLAQKLIDKPVFLINGSTEVEDRENTRAILEQSTNAVLIASYGTFSTGANVKNLHTGIFAAPSKSIIRVLQSIGRGLRTREGKEEFMLYDIGDNLGDNITINHFKERMGIYKDEQFHCDIVVVDFK
jgi:superfamily II DNA or RNA helicase